MTNQPLPAATPQKTGSLTFGLNRLSRDIGAALLTRAGGVMLATAAVLGLGALPLSAQAGAFQVSKLTDTADGTCDADCSLREAIAAANASPGTDTITFASNVTGTITLDITSRGNIDISDELVIAGPGADQLSISGGDVAPGTEEGGIFNATSAVTGSTITGLSLTNGNTAGRGGAVFAFHGLTLDDVIIQNSRAFVDGGGFYAYGGNVTLNNSTVSGNDAGDDGGGFKLGYGDATLTNSTVSGNNAGDDGGGFEVDYGDASVTNSTVSGNVTGDDGGGFDMDYGSATLTNSTVSGNDAGNDSGGFEVGSGNATLINSTVVGNTSNSQGGGIYVYSGDIDLGNSIVAGNSAPLNPDAFLDPPGAFYADFSLMGAYDGTSSGANNIVGTTAVPVDPLLGPLADNGGPTWTHVLGANSPAIDAGSNALAAGLNYDQRGPGYPRIVSGTVDMGAFERSDLIFADGFE